MTTWSHRLRNTSFKQMIAGFGNDDNRCAMGVIDDVTRDTAGKNMVELHYTSPEEIFVNVKCSQKNCNFIHEKLSGYIIHLNDIHEKTFKQIANIIEPIEMEHRVTNKEAVYV